MDEETCSICLDTIDYRITLNCKHFFCINCYKLWNERSNLCPMCKTQIESPQIALESSIGKVISHLDHILCLLEKIKSIKSYIPDDNNQHQNLNQQMVDLVSRMSELGVASRPPTTQSENNMDQFNDVQIDMLTSLLELGMGNPSFLGNFR